MNNVLNMSQQYALTAKKDNREKCCQQPKGGDPSPQHCWVPPRVLSSGTLQYKWDEDILGRLQKDYWDDLGTAVSVIWGNTEDVGTVNLCGILSMCKYQMGGNKEGKDWLVLVIYNDRTRDNRQISQYTIVNLNKGKFLLWYWSSTGTGFLEMFWNLHLMRHSKSGWTPILATCSSLSVEDGKEA